MTPDTQAKLRGNLYQLIGTFCWATAFPATGILLASWSPLPVAAARIGGGALVLLAILVVTGRLWRMGPVPWGKVVPLGCIGFGGGAGGIVLGQSLSDPVTVAVIATCIPILSAIMGYFEGTERLRPLLLLGIGLAVAGGILVSVAPIEGGAGFRGGEILVLLSQVCWAWFSRRAVVALAPIDPIARAALPMAAGALLLTAVTLLVWAAGIATPRISLDLQSLGLIAWIAVAGIGLSVTLWLLASALLGVTIAALHINLGPFYVMLLSLGAGGAVLTGQVAGAVMVALGAVIAQLGPRAVVAAAPLPPRPGRH